jgi:hypothetical protein
VCVYVRVCLSVCKCADARRRLQLNKMHPRDFLVPGRVRVEIKNEQGELVGPIRSRTREGERPRVRTARPDDAMAAQGHT